MTGGRPGREGLTATTVLLATAVGLLALAVVPGVAGVVTASFPLLGASIGLAIASVVVLLACGLLAGARTTLAWLRRRPPARRPGAAGAAPLTGRLTSRTAAPPGAPPR